MRAAPRYSRKGHTVSYIGAEFQDEAAKPGQKSFVIVVRVESENPDEDMRHVQQRWYITPGRHPEELPFLGPDRVPTKREQFCLKRGKMQNTDKQETARDWICRALGIGSAESPLARNSAPYSPWAPVSTTLRISGIYLSVYPPPAGVGPTAAAAGADRAGPSKRRAAPGQGPGPDAHRNRASWARRPIPSSGTAP